MSLDESEYIDINRRLNREDSEIVTCYAFVYKDGTIDIDTLGETEEHARLKMLESCMGWRFKYVANREEAWDRITKTGEIRQVYITTNH